MDIISIVPYVKVNKNLESDKNLHFTYNFSSNILIKQINSSNLAIKEKKLKKIRVTMDTDIGVAVLITERRKKLHSNKNT